MLSFNRTSLELKSASPQESQNSDGPFNRTSLELKSSRTVS